MVFHNIWPARPAYPYLPPSYAPTNPTSPPADLGTNPVVEYNTGCLPVGIGSKGDIIHIVVEYLYMEGCGCPTDTYWIDHEWCPMYMFWGQHCHCNLPFEGTGIPGVPLSDKPAQHTARCPSTQYRYETRQWLSGASENTIESYIDANYIKPSYWIDGYAKPWWLTDLVIDTNGIFVFQNDRQDYWLLHLDPSSGEVINQKNIWSSEIICEYGLRGCRPNSIAGNGTTIYILWSTGWAYPPHPQEFFMTVFDVATWSMTDRAPFDNSPAYVSPNNEDYVTPFKLAGDGTNGYIYCLTNCYATGYETVHLEKRHASAALDFAVVSSIDLTETYHTLGSWNWNPICELYTMTSRIWCFGGDSNRLFAAGYDCVDGDVAPIFYEFDPGTLAYVGKSDICKCVPADPVKIISFW